MAWFSRVRSMIQRLRSRRAVEQDLDEELRSYYDIQIERRIRNGLTREEAARLTRLELGGAEQAKEKVRDERTGAAIEGIVRDVRYACRVLRKNPGFATVAILSLSLGLGANTAIFTLINTVMLKSLPVANPERLFFIDNSGGKSGGGSGPPYPCYEILRDQNHFFSGMAAFSIDRFKVTIEGAQEPMNGQFASGSYYEVTGVGAALGRVLTPEDDSVMGSGGPHGGVAVISHALWVRRFARDPGVLGRVIQVGTNRVTIVGVSREGFTGLELGAPADITIPMMLAPNNLRSKQSWWFSVVGRLKDGVSEAPARAELDQYFQTYMKEQGISGGTREYFSGIALVPAARGLDGLRRQLGKPLLIVMGIVGLVLLIGCANVANLLLARASARRHEIAVRMAVGASRGRIIRQLAAEGLVLVVAASIVSTVIARWGVSALVSLFAGHQGRIVLEPSIDWRVLSFTASVALITGLLFSIAPAVHAVRNDAAVPGSGGRIGMSLGQFRVGNVLVVAQVMLSMILLCGAALFLRSLWKLSKVDAGFQREGVFTVNVDATLPKLDPTKVKSVEAELAKIGRMWQNLVEPVESLAQVKAISASTLTPLSGRDRGILMSVSGEPVRSERDRGIHINQVSSGYFNAFGMRLLAGRWFGPRDVGDAPKVAILNNAALQRFFGASNPIGRRVTFPGQKATSEYEIVGIVHDTRYEKLREAAEPMVYVPIEQAIDPLSRVIIGIRMAGDPASALRVLRSRMQQVVPGAFMTKIVTVEQQVDESLLQERLLSILASLFGALALLLAAIGLYGIICFSVIRRIREIGIRIAVGAPRRSVLWIVLRNTLSLALAGLGLGIPLVLLLTKFIKSELYELQGFDPWAMGGSMMVLTIVALAAGVLPALRASRVDPIACLRQD